jgi:hypothetical protein
MSETIKDSSEFLKFKSKYLAKYTRWKVTQDENLGLIVPEPWIEYFDQLLERLNKLYEKGF